MRKKELDLSSFEVSEKSFGYKIIMNHHYVYLIKPRIVVAQGRKYEAPSENRTHLQ